MINILNNVILYYIILNIIICFQNIKINFFTNILYYLVSKLFSLLRCNVNSFFSFFKSFNILSSFYI